MARIYECASNKSVFKEYGGDLIFLLRNVVQTVGLCLCDNQNSNVTQGTSDAILDDNVTLLRQAAKLLSDFIHQWIHDVSLSEVEMHDILNIVEAMYVLNQLQIADESSVPSDPAIILCFTQKLHYPRISTNRLRWHDSNHRQTSEEKCISPFELRRPACRSSEPRKTRGNRNSASAHSTSSYSPELVREQLAEMLIQFDVTDMVAVGTPWPRKYQ